MQKYKKNEYIHQKIHFLQKDIDKNKNFKYNIK
jgi:hypothetical protein